VGVGAHLGGNDADVGETTGGFGSSSGADDCGGGQLPASGVPARPEGRDDAAPDASTLPDAPPARVDTINDDAFAYVGDPAVRAAVEADIASLLKYARTPVPPRRAKRRRTAATTIAPLQIEYTYTSMSAHIRTLYENLRDWQRSLPLTARRKNACPGKFDSYKLRALQCFVLSTGKGGLTHSEQLELYKLLDIWDGTCPGMAVDAGQARGLRDTFPSPNSFTQAIKDDIDDAVLKAGWRKCVLVEDGVRYKAYFRPVLELVLALMHGTRKVRLWSGRKGPAPPTHRRESPMDGDAFRQCEREVNPPGMIGPTNCVLGLHAFLDSSQMSWSGGKCQLLWVTRGERVVLGERVLEVCRSCTRWEFSTEFTLPLCFCMFWDTSCFDSPQVVPYPCPPGKLERRRALVYNCLCAHR